MKPITYTPEIGDRICAEIASGRTGTSVAREEWCPVRSTIRMWKLAHPEFAEKLYQARLDGSDEMAYECVDIADTERDAARSRERTHNRRWLASKIRPSVYGDRLDLRVTSTIDYAEAHREAKARFGMLRSCQNIGQEHTQNTVCNII